MNISEIRNPHRIYPGQRLVLDRSNGRARLRLASDAAAGNAPTETIRVSPRTRVEVLQGGAPADAQDPPDRAVLAEPVIVDERGLQAAPRIVACAEGRVLLTRGDRAYARGAERC